MFAKRYLFAFVVLSLLLLLIPACGGDGDETPTSTPTGTLTSTPTPTATATPNLTAVKIGAISAWSGPSSMIGTTYTDPVIKTIEKQVKDAGGILGGRPIQVVKYDNGGSVAQAAAGAKKLVLEDKVCILTLGSTGAEFTAISDAAEELKVPYVTSSMSQEQLKERRFTVAGLPPARELTIAMINLVNGILKPKTVAFMQTEDEIKIARAEDQRKQLEAAGIKIVSFQTVPLGTTDLMPFLTKVQYYNPEVLISNVDTNQYMTMAKQIVELGGWGNTKVVGYQPALAAITLPAAEGWIVLSPWTTGLNSPASVKFEQDYKDANGSSVGTNHITNYLGLLTAVEAIKFAGTDDPIKIAQGMRSGNLVFETPMGMVHFTPEGESGLKYMFLQIKGGKTVEFK
jgi:branched-chain amino acid transport system substrate-binding protein